MLKRFAEALFPQAPPPEEDREKCVALATCVVLLEAARIDDEYTDAEQRHILSVLAERFGLDEDGALRLLHEATETRDRSTDLWRFTHELNEAFRPQEKVQILEEVWRIFYSDGALGGHEDQLAHKLRNLLNLNQPQMIEAKMKVLGEIRGTGDGGV